MAKGKTKQWGVYKTFPGWIDMGLHGIVIKEGDMWISHSEYDDGYQEPCDSARVDNLQIGQLASFFTKDELRWSIYRKMGKGKQPHQTVKKEDIPAKPEWVQVVGPDPIMRVGDIVLWGGRTDPTKVPNGNSYSGPEGIRVFGYGGCKLSVTGRHGATLWRYTGESSPVAAPEVDETIERKDGGVGVMRRLPGNKHHSTPLPLP